MVLGHEGVGIVEALGESVTKFKLYGYQSRIEAIHIF